MSAWSGAVAEWPYTRMTKSWPTFSSRDILEMSFLRAWSDAGAPAARAVVALRPTAVAPMVAASTVRLDSGTIAPSGGGADPENNFRAQRVSGKLLPVKSPRSRGSW